ncbi:MAG TPA: PLP-dependent aminotransferase family protein [Opitutaceae bacterium]|jgi:2-aminoadipate transaminase|nr:PLP-dependent aminotransferase family protein [Opitutaceae bacterium]
MKAVPVLPSRFSARSAGQTSSAIREILKVTEEPSIISFAGGLPAPELFPAADLAACADAVLASDGAAALQYGTTEGYRPLRDWVSGYLHREVGLAAGPDQLVITAGSQQGLDLVAKIFLDPGDVVLTENPAYLGALQAFRSYEARIVGLPTDGEGMDPSALADYLRTGAESSRPKLLYLVTNFQNPTGLTTTARRRGELARVAAEFDLAVLEDDPYGALRFEGDRLRPLASLPEAGHALYLGTASKMLAPGLRVAWLAARDPQVRERIVVAKQACDLHTSSLTQRLVEHYVRAPERLEAHLTRLRSVYRERRNVMVAALRRWLPEGCEWTQPEGGLFLWVRLPGGADASELLPRALARKVAFVPGAPFWIGQADASTLRLNFSNADPERIEEGIRRLGEALRGE